MAESSTASAQLNLLSNLGLRDYLNIANRRKWWIALTFVGISICTATVVWRLPPIYSGETVVLVDNSGVPDKYIPSINTGDIAGRLTTLEQQVLSPTRLKKLVENQGLYPTSNPKDTVEQVVSRVQKSIIVEVVNPGGGRMSAFRIAYRSRNRMEVAPVANELAQMFIDENLKARVDQTEETAQFLDEQMQETKRQLDEKESELRGIEAGNAMDLPESKPYHIEALANLRSQMMAIQEKIQQYERDRDMLQSVLLAGTEAPTIDVGNNTATGSPYQAQIQKLEAHLADLKQRYGPAHPEIRRTENELARLKAQAETEAVNNPPVAPPQPDPTPIRKKRRNPVLESQIDQLNGQIEDQRKLLPPLQLQMKFHESKLESMPAFEQKIARIRQDYEALRGQYVSLQGKEQAARLSHALEVREKGEKFEILDAAVTPNGPVAPSRLLLSVAGMISGLLGGVLLAGVVEMNDDTVRSENEASRIVGKTILGGVPFIVSAEEQKKRRVRAAAMLVCTVAGSAAFGFVLSVFSGGLF